MGWLRRGLIWLPLLLTLVAPATHGEEAPEPLSAEDEALLDQVELLMMLELLEDLQLVEDDAGPVIEREDEDRP